MRETVVQAVKYGVVGAGNTVITAIVIWVFMKLFGCSDVTSNVVGYAAGVLNSFVWNKKRALPQVRQGSSMFIGLI